MFQIVLMFHVVVCVLLVILVLVQQGKGATMGAAFGSGASGTVFGSRGSGGFLLRLTTGLAIIFFITSLGLTYLAGAKPSAPQASVLSAAKSIESQQSAGQASKDVDNMPKPSTSKS
jgi:preprotein translocase subunit SecG